MIESLIIVFLVCCCIAYVIGKRGKHRLAVRNFELEKESAQIRAEITELKKLLDEKEQSYPFLAIRHEELISLKYDAIADQLCAKSRPAFTAAKKVRELSKEVTSWVYKAKIYQHQLEFYEDLFPWLEEFKELPTKDTYDTIHKKKESDKYSHYKNYLSPTEYNKLSQTEKNQLALERYKKRSKSNWEAGI